MTNINENYARRRRNSLWASLLIFFSLPFSISLFPTIAASQHEGPTGEEESSYTRSYLPNFTPYRKTMIALCGQVYGDGRGEALYSLLLSLRVKDTRCIACKAFFDQLATTCKPPKQKPAKSPASTPDIESSPIPQPSRVYKQREPHAGVIDLVSQLSFALYQDQERRTSYAPVIQKFASALKASGSKYTPGEQEYFQIMSSYLLAPFEEYLDSERIKRDREIKKERETSGEINKLFE